MTVGELTRQYQDALERRRIWVVEFGDVLSMKDELDEIDEDLDELYELMRRAWVEEQQERARARARS